MEKAKAAYRARRENEQAVLSSSGSKETDGSSDTEESGSLHQLESRAFAPETSLESPAPLSRRIFSGPVQMQRLPLKRLPSRVGIFQKKAPKRGRYDAASSTLARYASHARPGDAPDDPPDLWKGIAFTGDVLEDLNLSSPRRRELTPSTTTTDEEPAGRLSPTQSFLDFPPDAPNVSSESASPEKAAAQDRPEEDAGSPTPRSAFTWWGRPRNVPQRSSSRAANGKKRSEPASKATTPDAGSPKPSALNLALLEPKTPQPGERATDPGLRVGVDGENMSNESELQQ
ncbi:hypothetical protein BDZ97DRAFT_484520 [Flammula alnicola]|nr:hypothetical protein BDZ97DRAFT_484520 [Flammula alnicola]